jgi:hypothetical protein
MTPPCVDSLHRKALSEHSAALLRETASPKETPSLIEGFLELVPIVEAGLERGWVMTIRQTVHVFDSLKTTKLS